MTHIVGTSLQADDARLSSNNLMQTLMDTGNVIAYDTAIDDMAHADAFAPITASFCEAIAQHDHVIGGNGGF